jgi:hypothetical protein
MGTVNILSPQRARELMTELFATTRYATGDSPIPKDKHGMPIIAPEPDDPDDE